MTLSKWPIDKLSAIFPPTENADRQNTDGFQILVHPVSQYQTIPISQAPWPKCWKGQVKRTTMVGYQRTWWIRLDWRKTCVVLLVPSAPPGNDKVVFATISSVWLLNGAVVVVVEVDVDVMAARLRGSKPNNHLKRVRGADPLEEHWKLTSFPAMRWRSLRWIHTAVGGTGTEEGIPIF